MLHIGRKEAKPKPHIRLNGVGIELKHARIMNNDGRIFLVPQSVFVFFQLKKGEM
jgi:hypothetical protein